MGCISDDFITVKIGSTVEMIFLILTGFRIFSFTQFNTALEKTTVNPKGASNDALGKQAGSKSFNSDRKSPSTKEGICFQQYLSVVKKKFPLVVGIASFSIMKE